ncbi:MAG: glycosyltransferase family 2 protein [Clostridiaceae bacterium]|nr:glycosyltransferase family 2 protein [Clostridiaceae bacterium]
MRGKELHSVTIHILMATCNGERYLAEQLDSIGRQTVSNWKLHICDDASNDRTMEMIGAFAEKYAGQVEVTQNSANLGAKQNFAKLVREVREPGDYAFCDQDDIWEPDKLERLQRRIREEEKERKEPLLLFSDARLIDQDGNVLADSFWGASGLYMPGEKVFESLLLCNFAQGAAMLWNESLHRLLTDIPEQAQMHDWWTALVAAGHGRIVGLPEKLCCYRQHTSNVLGGFNRKRWHQSFMDKLRISNWKNLIQNNHELQKERREQAEAYQEMYPDRRAERYLALMKKNRVARAYCGISGGYLFLSWKYSLKYYLL